MDFTIITPSFKQLDWLRLCVASVADQAGEVTVEHIIQDGGSRGIAGFVTEVEAFLRDVHKAQAVGELEPGEVTRFQSPAGYLLRVFSEPDRGMYDAINKGLRRAAGTLCAYLNCDEQYLPGTLAKVREAFRKQPQVEIFFGDVVITGPQGEYLCSRKASVPWLFHTWVCTLPVFTAATFFRRTILSGGQNFFPDEYKAAGDAAWMLELLRQDIHMARLGDYASISTETGSNLILDPKTKQEQRRIVDSAPLSVRKLAILWKVIHRLRRFLQGAYWLRPFAYQIYTFQEPDRRTRTEVRSPCFSLPGRFGAGSD